MPNGDIHQVNVDNQLQQVNPLTPSQVQTIVTNSVYSALGTYGSLRIAPFDGESSIRAKEFIEEFENEATMRKLSDADKCINLQACLGKVAREWYKLYYTYDINKSAITWKDLKKRFLDYFEPEEKERYYEQMLNKRKQGYSEPVNQYITSKILLCQLVDRAMPEDKIMNKVFEDLNPQIKNTFT